MSNLKIVAIVGSIQKDSLNKKLLANMIKLAPEGVEVTTLQIDDLPMYNQDLEIDYPKEAQRLKDGMLTADGILVLTPEHNRSISSALKNAIDWSSRPYGTSAWAKKPVAVAGATMGNLGTFGAQGHLRNILSYQNVALMGQPEFYFTTAGQFNDNGEITDPVSIERINDYWTAFIAWIKRVEE
jgi:chromate reductase